MKLETEIIFGTWDATGDPKDPYHLLQDKGVGKSELVLPDLGATRATGYGLRMCVSGEKNIKSMPWFVYQTIQEAILASALASQDLFLLRHHSLDKESTVQIDARTDTQTVERKKLQ